MYANNDNWTNITWVGTHTHIHKHTSKINVRVVDKINEERHLCHTENRIFFTTTTTTAATDDSGIEMLKKISKISGKGETVYHTHTYTKRQSNFQTPTIGKWKVHRRLPVKHIPSPKQTNHKQSFSCFFFLFALQLIQTMHVQFYATANFLLLLFCTIDVCLYCVYALVQTS